jgi:predicted RNA-binding protein with RPS1 domain
LALNWLEAVPTNHLSWNPIWQRLAAAVSATDAGVEVETHGPGVSGWNGFVWNQESRDRLTEVGIHWLKVNLHHDSWPYVWLRLWGWHVGESRLAAELVELGDRWHSVAPFHRRASLVARAINPGAEQAEREAKELRIRKLTEGETVEGVVRNIVAYGAFIDLDGVPALLPNTSISHDRAIKAKDVFQVGDTVTALVDGIRLETLKVVLNTKKLLPDPWRDAAQKYSAGMTVKVKISKIMHYGVFAELEPGITGLIHYSKISWHPLGIRKKARRGNGNIIDAFIESVDEHNRRISLSLVTCGRFASFRAIYPPGSTVDGTSSSIVDGWEIVDLGDGLFGRAGISGNAQEGESPCPEVRWKVLDVDEERELILLCKS